MVPVASHLLPTHDLARTSFSPGLPEHGVELADDLESLFQLHGAETIAAVIVEPVAGSTGVLLPPRGYLERLRDIATRHGILLIFDEVITGFGRLGTPRSEEHTSELQSLMRISYAVFCLKKKIKQHHTETHHIHQISQ